MGISPHQVPTGAQLVLRRRRACGHPAGAGKPGACLTSTKRETWDAAQDTTLQAVFQRSGLYGDFQRQSLRRFTWSSERYHSNSFHSANGEAGRSTLTDGCIDWKHALVFLPLTAVGGDNWEEELRVFQLKTIQNWCELNHQRDVLL